MRETTILSVIIFLACPAVSSAATFFLDDGEGIDWSTVCKITGTAPDQNIIVLDDMVFTRDDVERSGFSGPRWIDGIIYYEFDAGVSPVQRVQWLNAAQVWSNVASLMFVERTSEQNYILVLDSDHNSSWVGMIGGEQEMHIASWNSLYVIVHEIGHALGAAHEHQRNDRGDYVEINFDFIQAGFEHNFSPQTTTNYGTYDFDSVMHYDGCAFSVDCEIGSTCSCTHQTITVLPPNEHWQDDIGQRTHLSDLDASGMATRYGGGSFFCPCQ